MTTATQDAGTLPAVRFLPSLGYPDQLRPAGHWAVYSEVPHARQSVCMCVCRHANTADLDLSVGRASAGVSLTADECRKLAAQLLAAAELIDAGANP
jgi:hypothetical protein